MSRHRGHLTTVVPAVAVPLTGTAAGAGLLGVAFPAGLFVVAAFGLNDTGGPLFWPILVVTGTLGGACLGSVFAAVWLGTFTLVRATLGR